MDFNELKISEVQENELSKLRHISIQTFTDTYGSYNTDENLRNYLSDNFSEQKIKEEWENPQSWFYFARLGEQIIGYIKLNQGKAQTEFMENDSIEIERIYLIQSFQGKKLGGKLVEKALEVARINKGRSVWLGVWEKNRKAINFYEKCGFRKFGTHIFELGTDKQTDYLMKKSVL